MRLRHCFAACIPSGTVFGGLAAFVFAALLAGGCGGPKAVVLKDDADFQKTMQENKQPALIMFWKQGCASCAALEPTMDKLAGEYEGKALVAKLMVLTFTFGNAAPLTKEKYEIGLVPTVILFVDGQERNRWVMEYDVKKYRAALDEAIGVPATAPAAAPKAGT